MGLDQMMFASTSNSKNTEFFCNEEAGFVQFGTWRKHPNLHGWMEKLFNAKADALGFEGETNFNLETIATALPTSPEIVESALAEGIPQLSSTEEMERLIALESFTAQAENVTKKRVFNRQPIRLSLADIDQLEMAVKLGELPATKGFFFGEDSSDHYKEYDLKVISAAKEAIRQGLDVYYDSWW